TLGGSGSVQKASCCCSTFKSACRHCSAGSRSPDSRKDFASSAGTKLTQMSKYHISLIGLSCVIYLSCLIYREFLMKNGKGGRGLVREERLQIMLSRAEIKAVDTFRFSHGMPSRAAAVRELLRHGLAAVGAVLENAGITSRDYGVLKAPKGLGQTRSS